MRAIVLLPLLAACQAEPLTEGPIERGELPLDALAGPGGLTIEPPSYMLRGRAHQVPYTGAYMRMRVWLYAARGGGSSCPPVLSPLCLGLADPALLVDVDVAGGRGAGDFQVMLPPTMTLGEIGLQAGAKNGALRRKSPIAMIWVGEPADDDDGDGLTNGEEVDSVGTDPLVADSDGGGEDDATEVAHGSDPLDPSDDL